MKKALLLFISLIISVFFAQIVLAYQTVLVDFPPGQGWHPTYYGEQGDEVILQYAPVGQEAQNWTKSVVFHSYKNPDLYNDAARFMNQTTSQMELKNPSQMYKIIKSTEADSIATRCIKKNASTPSQCEIYRTSLSYEGLITMHYINKNTQDFKSSYSYWLQIMRDIRIYYSYYRDDRILDKATIFEL